jgi:hypothetical protein
MGYTTRVDALEKTEIPCPCRELNNVLRSSSPWANHCTDYANPAPRCIYTCVICFTKQQRTLARRLDLSSPETWTSAIGCKSLYDDAHSIQQYAVAKTHRSLIGAPQFAT